LDIGIQKHKVNWVLTVLNSRNRNFIGSTAKAKGLYLVEVNYPACFNLPKAPLAPLLF
jgi:tRNA pseudouridine38-40 synthase